MLECGETIEMAGVEVLTPCGYLSKFPHTKPVALIGSFRGPFEADCVKHAQEALGAISSDEDIRLINSAVLNLCSFLS